MRRFRWLLGLLAVAIVLIGSACVDTKDKNATKKSAGRAASAEQESIAKGFERLTKSQPVPVFDYSEERQTLINVETMRAQGTHGTAQAYSLDGTLLWWCPTQGAPVPSSYMLAASDSWVDLPGHGETLYQTDQGEPTGVYIGDSAATWTVCLDDNGTPFAQYEEATVRWTGAEVRGLPFDKRASADELTYEFEGQTEE